MTETIKILKRRRKLMELVKLSNTFVCFNLTNRLVKEINENDHPALSMIHIFVNNADHVNARSLAVFAENARERNMKIIVHCLNRKILKDMRKKLRGVYKDKFFHLSDFSGKMMRFYTDNGYIFQIVGPNTGDFLISWYKRA